MHRTIKIQQQQKKIKPIKTHKSYYEKNKTLIFVLREIKMKKKKSIIKSLILTISVLFYLLCNLSTWHLYDQTSRINSEMNFFFCLLILIIHCRTHF